MFSDPPEDGDRTVFCQTCEKWCHPRHSCARDPSHETAPLPIMLLRREGPSSGEIFTGTSYESKRKHGIGKLELTTHSKGTSSTLGDTRAVYYLIHEHPPTEVIKKWLKINKEVLAGRDLSTENITRGLSKDSFKAAWSDLQKEVDFEFLDDSDHSDRGHGENYKQKQCPFCDKSIKSLAGHLPCSAQSEE